MAMTFNAIDMPDAAIGLALSSPGLCSPGLYGEQGWSPCSSLYSDMDDDLEQDYFRRQINDHKRQKRHTMMEWPVPPARVMTTRPLSFNKYPLRSPAASISSGSASSSDESSAVTLADAPGFDVRQSPRKAMNKRFFSAPLPKLTMEKLGEHDTVRIVSPNVFDESLPLMPLGAVFEDDDVDEEYVKMARLEASMSLLGVQSGPRVGHYEICSPVHSTSSPRHVEQETNRECPNSTLSAESQSPTAGLCLLRMAFSPEHKAPSLQEQMAFASGLGNMCAWASPLKQTYASADDYLRSSSDICADDEDGVQFEMLTSGQAERRYASRHIRQGVAASSAAAFVDRLNELSPISRLAYGNVNGDDLFDDAAVRPASHFSTTTSNAVSEVGSPILHGVLSATSFASSSDEEPSRQISDSPALASDEYSYLADNDAFLATLQGSPQAIHTAHARSGHWPDENGFDGNTLSPSLATPELGLVGTPASMNMIPSPSFAEESICPSEKAVEAEWLSLPISRSAASVLERPRPISTSRSVSFFTHNDVEGDYHHLLTRERVHHKRSPVEEIKVEEAKAEPIALDAIPPRKASLAAEAEQQSTIESVSLPKSRSTTSIIFRDEPHPRHLLRIVSPSCEEKMSKSSSTGYLGPKAISQVREACRAKAVLLAGGEALAQQLGGVSGGGSGHEVPPVPSNGRPRGILKRVKTAITTAAPNDDEDDQPTSTKHMPVLFVARTPSQRKRGVTGVAETEPENLAKAKLGLRTDVATRSSTVHAVQKMPSKVSSSSRLQLVHDHGCQSQRVHVVDDTNDDPSLLIAAELQQGVGGMPSGFVLIVEETSTVVTNVLPTSKLLK